MPKGTLTEAQAVTHKAHTPRGAAHYAHRDIGTEILKPRTGYWWVKVAEPDVWVKRSRLVAEAMLGRPLLPNEKVHHRDGDKANDAPDNLVVLTQRQHITEHRPERSRKPDWAQRAALKTWATRRERYGPSGHR
jgi:hypothetical protein